MKKLLLVATLLFAGLGGVFAQETLEGFQWANGDKENLAVGWHGFTWGMSLKAVIAKMGKTDDASDTILAYEGKSGPFRFDGQIQEDTIVFQFKAGRLSAIWLPNQGGDFDAAVSWFQTKFGEGTVKQSFPAKNVVWKTAKVKLQVSSRSGVAIVSPADDAFKD